MELIEKVDMSILKQNINENIELINKTKALIQSSKEENKPSNNTQAEKQDDSKEIVIQDNLGKVQDEQKIEIQSYVLKKLRFKEQVNKIKEMSSCFRYKQLGPEDIELIGDKSYVKAKNFTSKIKDGNPYQFQTNEIDQSKSVLVIDPDGLANSVMSLFISLFTYFKFIMFPLGFTLPNMIENSSIKDAVRILNNLALVACFMKILIGFITGFKRKNILIEDPVEIVRNYLKTEFFFDIIPPIEIIVSFTYGYNILSLIHFFRITTFTKLMEYFSTYFHIQERYAGWYHITRLIIIILSVAHYNAMMFHYISQTGASGGTTWIQAQNLDGAVDQDIYERVLYFILITMITVGFGDVSPVSSRQRIFIIFMTLFSCFLFGYAVNTVGSIFQQKDLENSQLKQIKHSTAKKKNTLFSLSPRKKQFQISNYLDNRGVQKDLHRKVLREIDYIFQMERDGLFDDQFNSIMDQVSKDLQDQIITNISLKILRNCELINDALSLKCLEEFSQCMKEKTLIPGEVLFRKGEIDSKIFYVNKGEMEIYIENSEKRCEILLRRISEKSFLGEQSFLNSHPHLASVRSIGVTHIIYFQYEDLKQILVNYPADFERLNMQRDQIMFGVRSTQNMVRCYVCQHLGHMMTKCPRISINLNQNQIWSQYLYQLKTRQIRQYEIKRQPKQQRFQTLLNMQTIREALIRTRQDLIANFMENDDFQNQSVTQNLAQVQASDQLFYKNNPKIKFCQNSEIVIDENNNSMEEYQCEDDDESFYPQDNDNRSIEKHFKDNQKDAFSFNTLNQMNSEIRREELVELDGQVFELQIADEENIYNIQETDNLRNLKKKMPDQKGTLEFEFNKTPLSVNQIKDLSSNNGSNGSLNEFFKEKNKRQTFNRRLSQKDLEIDKTIQDGQGRQNSIKGYNKISPINHNNSILSPIKFALPSENRTFQRIVSIDNKKIQIPNSELKIPSQKSISSNRSINTDYSKKIVLKQDAEQIIDNEEENINFQIDVQREFKFYFFSSNLSQIPFIKKGSQWSNLFSSQRSKNLSVRQLKLKQNEQDASQSK